MTVYLIDGYNVLHQFLGRNREEGRGRRSPPGEGRGNTGRRRSARLPEGGAPEAGAVPVGALKVGSPGEAPRGGAGEPDLEDERRRLIDRIASYMGGSADRAIVVFDSQAHMLQKIESATANVEIYFGSFSRSADSIIEREVYDISAGKNVVVVSSDYQLQKTIFLPNVIRRSSRQFVADLQEHTKSIANTKNCITMGNKVEERVDPGTVDRLKALREELAAAQQEPGGPGRGSEA
jgi:predicted RNA-binding protein with PIN domain